MTHRAIRANAMPAAKMARMEWIIKHGTDLSLRNDFNATPLITALHDGPSMVNLLIDVGGTPDNKDEFKRIIKFYLEREKRANQKSGQPITLRYPSILEHLYKAYRAKFGHDYEP